MKYLLDTCVLSEMTKPLPSEKVVRWIRRVDDAALSISVLTLGELEKGVIRLAAGKRKAALEEWLHETSEIYAGRILEVTVDIAVEWGRVSAKAETKGKPLPVVDGIIGATAVVRGLAVVTRNAPDIERTGARVVNPWE